MTKADKLCSANLFRITISRLKGIWIRYNKKLSKLNIYYAYSLNVNLVVTKLLEFCMTD